MNPLRPAIFLDRDGVIIENKLDYVRQWSDVRFIPGALAALAGLAASRYLIVIVTNQAGVGHGHITLAEARAINQGVVAEIRRAGGRVDGAYLCPHRPQDGCECRKPRPGMLLHAARDLGVDLSTSLLIGDAISDVQAALAAGVRPTLVRTGRGEQQFAALDSALRAQVPDFPDLPGARAALV
ncbi:MAG: HAD-IIIA family hydrolase [Chloroflexi bacterium]|nr:HAD-IIIA family hydrolase [Chloroflexota bacterium]